VAVVIFLIPFVAGEYNLLRIDDHNRIPGIHMGCKQGVVFSSQARRDRGGQTAKNQPLCIDNPPFIVVVFFFGTVCILFHINSPLENRL
jgi:hypothetical protein